METYEYKNNAARYQYTTCGKGCNYLEYLTRLIGVFTAVVIFGVGVDITVHKHSYGLFLITISILVGFFEITWVINLFLSLYIQNDFEPELTYWNCVLWIRTWKKMLLYALFSFLMLIFPYRLWLLSVACFLLVWLAILHGLLSFKTYCQTKSHILLSPSVNQDSFNDSRFDRFLDHSIPLSPSADNLFPLDRDGVLEL